MRPIKLEIQGIHSFRDNQVIDFEKISRKGIFGIFGKTGSGKSTILDSIILALYGNVARSKTNSDFINSKSKEARVLFIFSSFEKGKKKTFEVERIFKRKKKNPNDIEQSAQLVELNLLNRKQLAEGAFKVDEYLKELIGMGQSEFSKCIALPQGEFAGFLKAKPADRINIIGNIFDLNKYGQPLWEKVTRCRANIDKKIEVIEGQLSVIDNVEEKSLSLIEKELDAKRKELKIEEKEIESMLNEKAKLEAFIELQRQQKIVNKKIVELENQKPKFSEEKELLQKSFELDKIGDVLKRREGLVERLGKENKKFIDAKSQLEVAKKKYEDKYKVYNDNFEETEEEIDKSITKLNLLKSLEKNESRIENMDFEKAKIISLTGKLKIERDEFLNKMDSVEDSIKEKEEIIKRNIKVIDENKEKVSLYNELSDMRVVSKQIETIGNFCVSIENMIDGKNLESKQAMKDLFDLSNKEKELRKELTKIIDSIDKYLNNHTDNSYEKLRQVENKYFLIRNADNKIGFIKTYINELNVENEEHLDNITKFNDDLSLIEKRVNKFDSDIEVIENDIISEQEQREGYLGQNVLSIMLENLNIGDECPICRSDIIQKNIASKTDLVIYDKNISALKIKIKVARVERDKVVFELASKQTMIEEEKSKIKFNQRKIEKLKKDLEQEYIKFVDINDQTETNFASMFETIKMTINKLEKLIKLEESIKSKMENIDEKRIEFGTKSLIYKETASELSEIYEILQSEKAEKELLIFNYTGKEKSLYQSMDELRENIKISNDAKKIIEELTEEKRVFAEQLLDLKLKYASIQSEIENSESKIKLFISQIREQKEPIEKESYGKLSDYIIKFEEKLNNKKKQHKDDKNDIDNLKGKVDKLENDTNVFNLLKDDCQEQLENIELEIEKTKTLLKINFDVDIKKYLISKEQRKIIEDGIQNFESTLSVLKTESEIIREKLSGNIASEVDYINICQKYASATAEQNERREKIGNMVHQIENMKIAYNKTSELKIELDVLSKKQVNIKQLYDMFRGKALMEYVAEEYIDDITKIASRKLMLLKNGEFSLVCEDNDFFIIDNFDDGFKRSVATLSGGETFIVSLSLALAISEAIILSSDKSMEFFFLDEGFGTLDSELCETIISALYKLESQNLTIGLISHVAELKNSIQSKVIVIKKNDSSGSTIDYEFSV